MFALQDSVAGGEILRRSVVIIDLQPHLSAWPHLLWVAGTVSRFKATAHRPISISPVQLKETLVKMVHQHECSLESGSLKSGVPKLASAGAKRNTALELLAKSLVSAVETTESLGTLETVFRNVHVILILQHLRMVI